MSDGTTDGYIRQMLAEIKRLRAEIRQLRMDNARLRDNEAIVQAVRDYQS